MNSITPFAFILAGIIALYVVLTGRAEAFWAALLLGEPLPTKETTPPVTQDTPPATTPVPVSEGA